MDRRTSLKWVLAAAATVPALGGCAGRAVAGTGTTAAQENVPTAGAIASGIPSAGYGTDPGLIRDHHAGDIWPLTLSADERATAGALADLILPADDRSPSATAAGVVDFIDEWVSAPYPRQRGDRDALRAGLAWLEAESQRRHRAGFTALAAAEQQAFCDALCSLTRVPEELRTQAEFFARFRDIAAGGFYSSPFGRKDLQYLGNVALERFDGPPASLLARLGLG